MGRKRLRFASETSPHSEQETSRPTDASSLQSTQPQPPIHPRSNQTNLILDSVDEQQFRNLIAFWLTPESMVRINFFLGFLFFFIKNMVRF